MKRRSYKLSANDDWVEESWTVDCVCGVNFDDGEEMVNCDDCGVWVHTRCSRYVKGEKVFACDKCKSRKSINDSEETEVAQLLVELPTKTLRMENQVAYRPPTLSPAPALVPAYSRPCRLWTEIPIEEKVHVQGIPGVGSDPSLFSGVSSIFGPQLWKCTGYIPKKFNFCYKEFPSWDKEEEVQQKKDAVSLNSTADNVVGVLVSSSKHEISSDQANGTESQTEDDKDDKLCGSELVQKPNSPVSEVSRPQIGVIKEQILPQTSHIQSEKRKEEHGILRDRSRNKKARIMENPGELKKKKLYMPGTASTSSSDTRKLHFHNNRSPKAQKADPQINKDVKLNDSLTAHQLSQDLVDRHIDSQESKLASNKHCLEESLLRPQENHSTRVQTSQKSNTGAIASEKLGDSSKIIVGDVASLQDYDSRGVCVQVQVVSDSFGNTSKCGGKSPTGAQIESKKFDIIAKDMPVNQYEAKPEAIMDLQESCGFIVHHSPVVDPNVRTIKTPGLCQEKYPKFPVNRDQVNNDASTVPEACTKTEDVGRGAKVVNGQKDVVSDAVPIAHHQPRLDSGGVDACLGGKKSSTEIDLKITDVRPKPSGTILNPALANGERELVLSVGSNSSVSAVSSKSSEYGNHMSVCAKNDEDIDGKQKKMPESNIHGDRHCGSAVNQGEGSPERPKILLTKLARSAHGSVSKSTQMKKVFHSSISKRTLTDSRESMTVPADTLSQMPTTSTASQSVPEGMVQPETTPNVQKKADMLQTGSALSVTKKVASSVLSQKVEKVNQPVSQISAKGNANLTHVATSSNPPAKLSDEELALLLHQELNSSPRVPRAPRMRHAGSLPQLTSPTATSMLIKRTSSTSGKDHGLASRRKEKDSSKAGSRGLQDGDDEIRKADWVPSLTDHGGQGSGWPGSLGKRELGGGPTKGGHSMKKKKNAAASAATTGSDLSPPVETTEHHSLTAHRSRRNPPGDGNSVLPHHPPRTLPGLIAEIMSKGQRMTYEELCNAVLPHWPNLRKHNGERYAYSSHSQAVLDCLRNRNEWARLVDRGPKQTSGGRKRRKPDADIPSIDSEDNDDSRGRAVKSLRSKSTDSSYEELSRGRRKTQKWTLKARGISRRRRRIEDFSDDEADSYLNSSEDTISTDDEVQGGETSEAGTDPR